MNRALEEGEPEYTDTYICIQCGHRATIPSLVIITSQFISGLLGTMVCLYLMAINLSQVLSAIQFGLSQPILTHSLFVIMAAIFIGGFGYTIFRDITGLRLRHQYLKKP